MSALMSAPRGKTSRPDQSTIQTEFSHPATSRGGSALGAVGGFQAGYNWQFAPAWVVGVEGDFSWTSLSDQRGGAPALGTNGLPAGPGSSVTLNANTQWLASARAKLGFTGWFNNTMLYVTGGGAWENIEYNATFITTPPLNLANPSQTTTKSGWVAGVGAEWMATPNILLRAEYLYYGIDSSNNLSAVAFPIPAPLPVAVNWGKENIQVFRVAVELQVLSLADPNAPLAPAIATKRWATPCVGQCRKLPSGNAIRRPLTFG